MTDHASRAIGRTVPLIAIAAMASGCMVISQPEVKQASATELVDRSIAEAAAPSGVVSEDARVITDAVAAAPASGPIRPLAWANPSTGSSGTIVAIDRFMGKHGQSCRGFKTSVDTFMGIAFYDGEACQISATQWVLSWFKSSDG